MSRFEFVVFHGDTAQFLEKIREIGLVDITTTDWVGTPEQQALFERSEHLYKVAKAMQSVEPAGVAYSTIDHSVNVWDKAESRLAELESQIAHARVEAQSLAKWGDFDPKTVKELRSQGVNLRFFECDHKTFRDEWSYQYPLEIVHRGGANVYFVVVAPECESLSINAMEISAPTSTEQQKLDEIEYCIKEQANLIHDKQRAAQMRGAIRTEADNLREEFDFEQVMTSGEDAAEGKIKVIEGWCERENASRIKEFARGEQVIFFTEDASEKNNPPIKLKNNFFAKLYEPVGALYMLPRYNELDLTPFFAPFFMIFFGMCFGDAGYGIVLILAILALWKKIPVQFRGFAWLGIFLNLATILFGALTGNVFGIELAKVEALAPVKDYFIANENMFNVAIGLGAVQVLFGQILRIFNRAKKGGSFLYGLSSLGWVILFIGSGLAFAELIPSFTTSSLGYYITLGVACFLIFFMNSPGKNPALNFGKGLYSCYEQATGVVGDLISYVRLFAIGLAGAIIAQVFNALSVGLSGDIPVLSWIVMLIILLIGHGLNIFISILGAFVHPVRLTFVEFYKNAEFEGGGRRFNPFKRVRTVADGELCSD